MWRESPGPGEGPGEARKGSRGTLGRTRNTATRIPCSSKRVDGGRQGKHQGWTGDWRLPESEVGPKECSRRHRTRPIWNEEQQDGEKMGSVTCQRSFRTQPETCRSCDPGPGPPESQSPPCSLSCPLLPHHCRPLSWLPPLPLLPSSLCAQSEARPWSLKSCGLCHGPCPQRTHENHGSRAKEVTKRQPIRLYQCFTAQQN